MLAVRLQVRGDSFLSGCASAAGRRKSAEILVLQKCETRRCIAAGPCGWGCGIRADTAAVAPGAIERRNERAEVSSIQSVGAVLPILAAKRADGQVQLHDVVDHHVAAEQFHFAVSPGRAEARSDLIAPAKVNGLGGSSGRLVFSGEIFLFKTNTCIDGESATYRPSILDIKAMVAAERIAIGSIVLHLSPAIETLAAEAVRFTIGCVASHVSRRAFLSCRDIRRSSSYEKIYVWLVKPLIDVVGKLVELIANLEIVRAPPSALDPKQILIELEMLICIADGIVDVISHVEEPRHLLK